MIPYFEQPSLDLGPVTVYAFGVLVAAAILVGTKILERRSARVGLDPHRSAGLAAWILVAGFLGAHLVNRLVYQLDETWANPWTLLRISDGLSSFGGFFGGILGAWLFSRRHGLAGDLWRYLDAAAYAVPVAWFLGRVGCFLAYDHVGTPTDFLLGQQYRDGLVRHNLGLEEALYWIPLAMVMFLLGRKSPRPGVLVGTLAILYTPGRFLLDFLRLGDDRYLGLVASQYGSIVLLVLGAWVLLHARHRDASRSLRRLRENPTRRVEQGGVT